MQIEIFTAYSFSLIFTIILFIFNIFLNKYLKDKKLFRNWNFFYALRIILICTIILQYKFLYISTVLTHIANSLSIYTLFRLFFILKNDLKRNHKYIILLTVIHLIYNLYFSYINNSLFYRAILNNPLYAAGNISVVVALHKIPSKNKIKKLVSLAFILVALGWILRFIMFFTQTNTSLISNNKINIIAIYTLIPLFALQNISIVMYVIDTYNQENIRIKKRNISLQHESVFTNFLLSLFHEINTPLSVAMTGITSIQKSEKDKSKQHMEELIINSLEKIISLLHDRKLVYGLDEKINEAYIANDLDKIIKRILEKNVTTRNLRIVTRYHTDVIKVSLRDIFSILLPLLEMFQLHKINNEVVINFISDKEMKIKIINNHLFSQDDFISLKLPDDEDIFNTLDQELSEKLHYLSNHISRENRRLEIIHENRNEIYRIKLR